MKKTLSILLVLVLCVSLCSCVSKEKKLIGAWSGTWVWDGEQISASFILTEDGRYTRTVLVDGEYDMTEVGTWEFKDNCVIMHENGDLNDVAKYEYKNGKLYNGPNEHIKQGIK